MCFLDLVYLDDKQAFFFDLSVSKTDTVLFTSLYFEILAF